MCSHNIYAVLNTIIQPGNIDFNEIYFHICLIYPINFYIYFIGVFLSITTNSIISLILYQFKLFSLYTLMKNIKTDTKILNNSI